MESIDIDNAKSVPENLEELRNFEVPENWTDKKKDMAQFGKNGEEIFKNIIRTFHNDFNFVTYVDLLGGEAYWFNTNLYEEYIEEHQILLRKKSDTNWYIVYDNKSGKFYPTIRAYLLNGYSFSGKKELKYPSIKFVNKMKKGFVPRVHQIVALFGYGIATFDSIEKDRTLEINHLDPKVVEYKVTNNGLGSLEITTKEGNVEHREENRERLILVNRGGEIVFNI
jgi:hypothetical protein